MRIFKYRMKFDTEWIDVSTLINSSDTEIKNSLCTTEYKSVTNTCSFTLIPSEGNGLFYAQIQEKLLQAKNTKTPIDVEISRLSDNVVLFGGYIDNSKLTVTSTKSPDKTSISGNDYIASLLDKKINLNLVYENKSILFIVSNLLKEAGYTGTVDTSEALNGKTCKYFVTTDDDDATYRDIIDTLLFEIPGFVLYRNPATKKYEIRQIVGTAEPTRTVSYRLSDKLVTNTKIFDKDGIRIKYPTVDVKEGRPVYVDSVNEGSPAEIPAQHYYPENGDVQATLQEYDKNLLDRAYNTSESRLQNSDLDILYVKNAKLNIFPSNEDNSIFDFPVLQTLDMPSNPVWYPRKAWILLRNKTDKTVNLELMNIEGDVVYKSKINNITLPAKATDPAEYESSYIFDETHASEFARWYYHMQTIATTTSTWTEVNLESKLGEKVIVSHKDSAVSQAHVVVQINNISLGGGVRGYKVTAVALSDFGSYEYAKDVRLNSTGGKTIFQEYNEYYNSDSFTELVGGTWSTILTIDPNKTLWMRRVVRYIDGTYYYSTPAPSGSKGEDGQPGQPGAPGADGSYISFDISRTIVDYYADNYLVDNTAILFKAKSDLKTTIAIDGRVVTNSAAEVAYEATPSVLFANKNSILATASNGKMQQTFSVVKNLLTGSLSITADKTSVTYYADNVPHDANDKITLTVTSTNYKLAPKLYLNGQLQTTENSANYTFDVSQSLFKDTREITAKVTCGNESSFLTMTKVTDAGSISISCDKSEIGYYADNVPLNATEVATVSVVQTGYSKLPTLKINGIEKDYTTSVLTDSATYIIQASDLSAISKINAEISIAQEIQSVSVSKRMEQATISLTVSEGVAEYYYDNVAISGDITASVTYSGLYYAPLLKAGSTAIALTDGQGTIPISLFDDVDSGLEIIAYAQKFISYSVSQTVIKQTRPLSLSLGITGGQFSYDNDNNVSPSSITVTNNTEGLSDKGLVSLMVGGEIKSWTDGAFIVTPAMVTGRYIAITIGYGGETTTAIVTKTYDGKAEIVEYSKTRSFTIYPDDEYGFEYNAQGVVYNGETMAWVVPWSTDIPDVSGNEYLWRRSRVSDADPWQYTRLTGVKGDDGQNAGGVYLGHFTTAPASREDGSAIENGDYYLDISVAGEPKPYRYRDGQWVLVTAEDADWTVIASATMQDVNNYGGALLSTSAYYAFFQLLSAQKAFIRSLGAQEITINNGGAIQSENYESSGGAEGFRIGADGNADFFNGTWRGSFANGLSFIPPTKMHITRSMKHKDVYRMMKKQGIAEGVYNAGPLFDTSDDDGCVMVGQAFTEQPPAFCCMDYDEEKMDAFIPINLIIGNEEVKTNSGYTDKAYMHVSFFGNVFNIWPIASDAYLLLLGTVDSSTSVVSVDGFYLLTKAKLEAFIATEKVGTYLSSSEDLMPEIDYNALRAKYLTKQTAFNDNIVVSQDGATLVVFAYSYYDSDSLTFHMLTDDSTDTGKVHHYHFTAGDATVTYDGNIVTGYAVNRIAQFIIPAGYIHKIGGKYQMRIMAGAGSASAINRIFESEDMTNWTYVQMLDLSSYKPADATYMSICDVVKVAGRVFMIVERLFTSQSGKEDDIGFYELTDNSLINIPAGFMIKGENANLFNTNLIVKDGIIYGSFGNTMFRYDTASDIYTDMTRDIIKSIRLTMETYTGVGPSRESISKIDSNSIIEKICVYTESGKLKTVPMQSVLRFVNLSWDNMEDKLLISINSNLIALAFKNPLVDSDPLAGFLQMANTSIYYDPADNDYKLFSLMPTNNIMGHGKYTSFNLLTGTDKSVYVLNNVIMIKGISLSKQPVELPNPSLDYFGYDSMMAYIREKIPLYNASLFGNLETIYFGVGFGGLGKYIEILFAKSTSSIPHYVMHPDRPMIQVDSSALKINSLYPIYDCRSIKVKEYPDRIEIYILGVNSSMAYANVYGAFMNQGLGIFASFYMNSVQENYRGSAISISSENLVPFLTIYKDSEDYMPAEIFWNFPAQLTAREDILKVNTSIVQMPIANVKNINS